MNAHDQSASYAKTPNCCEWPDDAKKMYMEYMQKVVFSPLNNEQQTQMKRMNMNNMEYHTHMFGREMISRVVSHYTCQLDAFCRDNDDKMNALECIASLNSKDIMKYIKAVLRKFKVRRLFATERRENVVAINRDIFSTISVTCRTYADEELQLEDDGDWIEIRFNCEADKSFPVSDFMMHCRDVVEKRAENSRLIKEKITLFIIRLFILDNRDELDMFRTY